MKLKRFPAYVGFLHNQYGVKCSYVFIDLAKTKQVCRFVLNNASVVYALSELVNKRR